MVFVSASGFSGVREVIKGHNFRVRDQSPWYDVNVLRVLMLIPEVANKLFLRHPFMIRRGQ